MSLGVLRELSVFQIHGANKVNEDDLPLKYYGDYSFDMEFEVEVAQAPSIPLSFDQAIIFFHQSVS